MDEHLLCEFRHIQQHQLKAMDQACFTWSTREISVQQWVHFCDQQIQIIPREERHQAHYVCLIIQPQMAS